MPRTPMVSADCRASKVAMRRPGTEPSPRSSRLWTCRSASAWELTTEIAMGVFWRSVSRFIAVTTISERPVAAMASLDAAAWVCDQAGEAIAPAAAAALANIRKRKFARFSIMVPLWIGCSPDRGLQ